MKMLLAAPVLLALAACGSGSNDTAAAGDQPNEATVEATMANETSGLDNELERDAQADENADAKGQEGVTYSYTCKDGSQVDAIYGTDDGTARVTIGKKTFAMLTVQAASGSKYHSDEGLSAGKPLTWWTKDNTAMLIQAEGTPAEKKTDCQLDD